MNSKRVLSLLLAALIAGTSIISTSCGKKEKKSETDTEKAETNNDGLVLPDPSEVNGGGETFDIYLAYNVFDADYIVEEETGDTIKDIIY